MVLGFLTKQGEHYGLTRDTALFLDRRSPAYLGGVTEFLLTRELTDAFRDLTTIVRTGTTTLTGEGTMETDHPVWVQFARAMVPMIAPAAKEMAEIVRCDPDGPLKVLDIAAGHGIFGISFAEKYPRARVTALDWPRVLEVARENAARAGVAERWDTIEGNAFDVDLGSGYDLVLLTNFLHHVDAATNESLLRRVHAALADGGRAVTLEFVPNEDRVSPPGPAAFSLTTLSTTATGDAFTFSEYERMFANAGFSRSELHPLQASVESVIVSHR